jgi:chromatin assembly factor 1 subunit B
MFSSNAHRSRNIFFAAESSEPLVVLGAIHYKHVTDLAWSPDGRFLVASSHDGYCTIASFGEGELGRPSHSAHDIRDNLRNEIATKRLEKVLPFFAAGWHS